LSQPAGQRAERQEATCTVRRKRGGKKKKKEKKRKRIASGRPSSAPAASEAAELLGFEVRTRARIRQPDGEEWGRGRRKKKKRKKKGQP